MSTRESICISRNFILFPCSNYNKYSLYAMVQLLQIVPNSVHCQNMHNKPWQDSDTPWKKKEKEKKEENQSLNSLSMLLTWQIARGICKPLFFPLRWEEVPDDKWWTRKRSAWWPNVYSDKLNSHVVGISSYRKWKATPDSIPGGWIRILQRAACEHRFLSVVESNSTKLLPIAH